jgi:hypothetical protein
VTRRSILAAGLLLSVVHIAHAGKSGPTPHYEPDMEDSPSSVLQGSTWVGGGGDWKFWLKELDDAERLNFIERTTGVAVDPFRGRPDQSPAYHTFLLVLENNATGSLSFNPQSCWLETNNNKIHVPRGASDLSFNYHVSGRQFPVAYEKVVEALFDQARTIEPGQRVSGLLIYDRVAPRTKRWQVGLRLILPDGERGAFNAPYRRVKR